MGMVKSAQSALPEHTVEANAGQNICDDFFVLPGHLQVQWRLLRWREWIPLLFLAQAVQASLSYSSVLSTQALYTAIPAVLTVSLVFCHACLVRQMSVVAGC